MGYCLHLSLNFQFNRLSSSDSRGHCAQWPVREAWLALSVLTTGWPSTRIADTRRHIPCSPGSAQLRGAVSPQAAQDFGWDSQVSFSTDWSSVSLELDGFSASGEHGAASILMGAGFPDDPGDVKKKKWEKVWRRFLCANDCSFQTIQKGLVWKAVVLISFMCSVDGVQDPSLDVMSSFPSTVYCWGCPSPWWVLGPFSIDKGPIRVGWMLGALSCFSGPCACSCANFAQLGACSFTRCSVESGREMPPACCPFSGLPLLLGSFVVHTNMRSICSISLKNKVGILGALAFTGCLG